jgi:SAM-dependent methyltransferase
MNAAYDQIAAEYYDLSHKTSRNFDSATSQAVIHFRQRVPHTGLILDVGAGRGRCGEYLGVDSKRIVQLDNSSRMLEVEPREQCLFRVLHRAESLPFLNEEFSCVTSFLCDPFLGLNFLSEAFRVISGGGLFVATTPSYEWGHSLRTTLGIDTASTRFITAAGKVVVPSVVIPRLKLFEMLQLVGFARSKIELTSHKLPENAMPISPDIDMAAKNLGCGVHELDIIYLIVARK